MFREPCLPETLLILARVLLHCPLVARRIADDLVIHVSDVHDVLELEAALAQEAPQDIHGDKGAEVADVAVVVDRGAAGVHANVIVRGRSEFFHLAGKRVVKAKRQTEIVAKDRVGVTEPRSAFAVNP